MRDGKCCSAQRACVFSSERRERGEGGSGEGGGGGEGVRERERERERETSWLCMSFALFSFFSDYRGRGGGRRIGIYRRCH